MKDLKIYLAGFLIAIGGFAFLKVGGIIGAILFAFGIIGVVKLQTPLYTGVAGTPIKLFTKFEILMGNICGALAAACILLLTLDTNVIENANNIVYAKINAPWYVSLMKAIMCGAIVDISVFLAKRDNSTIPLLIGIPTFVMCGFNHSIADAFYIGMGCWHLGISKILLYYIIVVIGNYIGCNIRQIFTKDLGKI